MSHKNYAVVLAGGIGSRMGNDIPKQFLLIDKLPVIVRTLKVFQNHDKINGIIVVVHSEYIDRVKNYKTEYNLTKILNVVAGGETRQISSYNGLYAWDYEHDDIIIFHDAVRPFLTDKIIDDCIHGVIESGAVCVCVKTTDTIVESSCNDIIVSMPDRTNLKNSQTPQAFRYKLISDAHENAKKNNFTQSTDDVRLVLNLGYQVKIVEGSYENIKITNAEDMILAEAIAKKANYKLQITNYK
jgi:2-C-methyl-D-erythritol 4-phosphate cytidylyltransferase